VRADARKGAVFVERQRAWEFEDADSEKTFLHDRAGMEFTSPKVQRKTQQFCRQVQRALNVALAERMTGDLACEVFVEHVSPAPNCGHLLVHIAVAEGKTIIEAMQAIHNDASRLRAEVAMAIARKRAPMLSFVPVVPAGGSNE
jgi:ribosome-binding factor A